MTLCKDCEHFKIRQQPIKGFDWGMAECTKYNLVVDFADKRKFKWLSCEDRPKHGGRGMTKEEAIEIVKSAFSAWESEFRVPNDDWSEEHEALDMAIEALKADRPRGEWIDAKLHGVWKTAKDGKYGCSVCGLPAPGGGLTSFCPNCGAKMDGERSE